LATQQKKTGYFSHASKRQVPNFTYDFNGNQIFFEKAKVESLNPMIIDAKAHVPSEKTSVKEDKNFFMGRKKKSKKKPTNQCVELPKVVNKENNNDEMLTFMEPRRLIANIELNPGVRLRADDFTVGIIFFFLRINRKEARR
jgi:hypothetical protein